MNNRINNIIIKQLFTNLENAKQNIAVQFSENYFDGDFDFTWLGEVLMIGDYSIDLKDIQFALCSEISEEILFKYLNKIRHYDLEDFMLGKKGRRKKNKKELKQLRKRLGLSEHYFEEAMKSMGIQKSSECQISQCHKEHDKI